MGKVNQWEAKDHSHLPIIRAKPVSNPESFRHPYRSENLLVFILLSYQTVYFTTDSEVSREESIGLAQTQVNHRNLEQIAGGSGASTSKTWRWKARKLQAVLERCQRAAKCTSGTCASFNCCCYCPKRLSEQQVMADYELLVSMLTAFMKNVCEIARTSTSLKAKFMEESVPDNVVSIPLLNSCTLMYSKNTLTNREKQRPWPENMRLAETRCRAF